MDKLGTMKKCPKCNTDNRGFSVSYIEPTGIEKINGDRLIDTDEYMEVKCGRCGYIRKEAPLDAKDGKMENR